MPEQEPTYKELVVRYPETLSEEVHDVLGSLAAANSDIEIEAIEAQMEKKAINSGLVEMRRDPDDPTQEVPVVTIGALRTFETQHPEQKGLASRFYRALKRSHVIKLPTYQHYFHKEPVFIPKEAIHEQGPQTQSLQYVFKGIRAEQAADLSVALTERDIFVHNIGERSIKFFADFCEELHSPST